MTKKKRVPFGFGFFEDDFERIRDEMDQMIEGMMKEFEGEGSRRPEKGPYVYGFSMKIGPEGKPIIQEFGNKPKAEKKGLQEEREPLVDVIEGKTSLKVIAELPGVSKEDIELKTENGDRLDIRVDSPKRKYQKTVELPSKVKPESAKASYKNGVLEVLLTLQEPKKEHRGPEHKIRIE